jgi:ABC-2 type transport system permease protein
VTGLRALNGASSGPVAQVAVLARRSVLATVRQLPIWIPGMIFPLMLAAVNAATFQRATSLPQFPDVDSFLDFLLPATMLQGVMFAAVNGGSDIALDIEDGFFERLLASPVWRPSILLGRLAGSAVIAGIQSVIFLAVFAVFGSTVAAGVPGMVVLIVLAMLMGIGIGGFAAAVGVRTGSQETVQNSFPLIFTLLFLSSAFFPTELMSGWYQQVAEANPITWLLDAARHLVIEGWSWRETATCLGVALAVCAVSVTLATGQLRARLRAA